MRPASRAAATASVIRLAAPRAEDAFPPRGLTAAIAGAACGVQIVAASA